MDKWSPIRSTNRERKDRNSLTVRVGRVGELSLNGAKAGGGGRLGICISVFSTTELCSPINLRQIICTFKFIFFITL